MAKLKVKVTDHAVVRYCERIKGVDLEFIRKDIIEKTREAIRAGASAIEVDGVRFAFDGNIVVTCYEIDAGRHEPGAQTKNGAP